MEIDILTLFPKMFHGPFEESILKRAQEKNLVKIKVYDLRGWAKDKHQTVDDRPYGGGTGMILKVDVIYKALKELARRAKFPFPPKARKPKNHRIILLDPAGEKFNQRKAERLSMLDHLILICGHYEGVDERIKKHLVHEEASIGDYVLTGGELPAMVLIDAVVRLIPGVLEKPEALKHESFQPSTVPAKSARGGPSGNHRAVAEAALARRRQPSTIDHQPLTIEYPQYTRPPEFQGRKVPPILLSGNHQKIKAWRQRKSLEKTRRNRPDLL